MGRVVQPEARALYEKIGAAYVRDWAAFMPLEVPPSLLEQRLARFLPRVPFYCTDTYATRPVYRHGYLIIEDVLRIGEPRLTGVMAVTGWFHDAVMSTALSPRGESFSHNLFGPLQQIHEREWQFAILNEAAEDLLDGPVSGLVRAATAEYHHGSEEDDDLEELYVSPFFAALYMETLTSASLGKALSESARWKVLVVGSAQRLAVEALHAQVAAAAPHLRLGEVRAHYILEVPNVPLRERYMKRAQRLGAWPRLLFDGRLHAL